MPRVLVACLVAVLLPLPTLPLPAQAAPVISARNVAIEPGARRETVVEGLQSPWAMAWLPDGDMLVTERPGQLRLVRHGRLDPRPIEGVPAVFAENQGGLLDVATHPDFARNRTIYLTYSAGTAEANRTEVARARLVDHRLEDLRVIFRVAQDKPGAQHFGSRLAWLADGTLLVSIGDGGNPPTMLDGRLIRENAQDLGSHLGKIVRIRDDGTVPDDNPFFGREGAQAAVWSYGHRNIQGLAYDPVRRAVWATEHGALGGDELNRARAGGNFGWPAVSMAREYQTGAPVSPQPSRPGMEDPLLVWDVAVAPSGLAVYRGRAFPQWQGDLFSGSLMSQDVRVIALDADGAVTGERALRVGQRVRDVREGPDGFLYVLTDEKEGRLLRFVPSAQGQSAPQAMPSARSRP